MTPGTGGALHGPAAPVAAAILCLATALAYGALGPAADPSPDFQRAYRPTAERILAGAGPTLEDGSPAIRYPPGYPALLAGALAAGRAVGASDVATARALQLAAFAAAGALLALLGRRVRPGPAALLAPAAWAVYPLALHLTSSGNSDLPFVPFLLAIALAFLAWGLEAERPCARRMAGIGVLAGIAMLIRPIAIGLGGLLALVLWAARRDLPGPRRAALIAALLAGNVAAALPWSVWASAKSGHAVILSTGGPASVRDGLTYAVENTGAGRPAARVPDRVRALQERIAAREVLDGYPAIAGALAEEAARSPGAAVQLAAIKAAGAWHATDSRRQEGLVLAIQLVWLAAIAVAGRRAWRQGGTARTLALLAGAVALYFWGMTMAGLSIVRYMVPAMALLMALLPALAPRPTDQRPPNP